jgi:hypothetical protein
MNRSFRQLRSIAANPASGSPSAFTFALIMGLSLGLGACEANDKDDEDEDPAYLEPEGPGTVIAPWSDFCVATFTEDTVLHGFLDETIMTARAGETYLLAALEPMLSDGGQMMVEAEIAFLSSHGPSGVPRIRASEESLPFETDCTPAGGESRIGVFTETIFYGDPELTEVVCTVPAGTILDDAAGLPTLRDPDFSMPGESLYTVTQMGAFAERCGDLTQAYLPVADVKIGEHVRQAWPYAIFRAD